MDVLQALERLGGAGRTGELTHVSRRALLRAVERGEVLRPARGVFALPRCERHHLAAVLVDGALTCASAARAHGLELLEPPGTPHIRCARGSRLTHPRVVVHRRGRPAGVRVVDVLTAVLDCARCLPLPEAVAVCDSALRRGLLDADDLAAAVGHLHGTDPRVRLVAHADARADSLLESVVRVELRERGLLVEVQVTHDDVGRVDLLVGGWLVVELDGYAFHAARSAFRLDRRRGVELARQGRVVLRFTYEDVLRRREWLIDAVVDVLAAGRPPFAA
ncbi:type IV toxin-antitoxin system AbiEi family antitoxin domain-containing protein [Kineococcus sp. G2]|uniref:type IV toxin-antitoxin system AbiEi family antitoxin domain-containing protein n=1 Tax=Kineococcus sp. G2 TaxID=3127484 RepID=UPI00301C77E6